MNCRFMTTVGNPLLSSRSAVFVSGYPSVSATHRQKTSIHWFLSADRPAARIGFLLMSTRLRSSWFACAALALLMGYSAHPAAQSGVMVTGRLLNSVSGDPIGGAT